MLLLSIPASAFKAEVKLADANQEVAAEKLFHEIRCLVCEGESLAESNAEMAFDMRALIRKKIAAGENTKDIKQMLVANYGEQILQNPQISTKTYFLWFFPAFMLIIAAIAIVFYVKKSSKAL